LKEIRGKCFNPECQETDFTELQFAHLRETLISAIPRGRGRHQRLKDVLLHLDFYTILCEFCHRKYDTGELRIKPISMWDALNDIE